jgi:hypothetical protein
MLRNDCYGLGSLGELCGREVLLSAASIFRDARQFVRNRTRIATLAIMEEHRDTAKLRFEAEHWRRCAADTREVARGIGLNAARQRMEEIAKEYDRLAQMAERIAAHESPHLQ